MAFVLPAIASNFSMQSELFVVVRPTITRAALANAEFFMLDQRMVANEAIQQPLH